MRGLGRNLDDGPITPLGAEDELSDSDRQRETPWAGTARVDEKNSLALLYEGTVGVTGKDRRKPSSSRLEAELGEVMDDVEGVDPDLDDIIDGQGGRPRTLIVVPPDCPDRRNGSKRIKDHGGADISAMHDEIRPAKPFQGLRPNQPVRVGDHADVPERLGPRG